MNKDQKIIMLLLGVLGLGVSGAGGYHIYKKSKYDNNQLKEENEKEEISSIYPEKTKKMHELLNNAESNFKNGEYRYALFDARIVFENALRMYTEMNKCEVSDDTIAVYLSVCESNDLFDINFIDKLHSARRTCNYNSHVIDCKDRVNSYKTNYVIDQIKRLLDIIDERLKTVEKEVLVNA